MGMQTSVRWCRTLGPVMRAGYLLAFALAVAACSDSPANPVAPLPVPMVPSQTAAVRIEGKVIDADSGEGIPGAEVRLLYGSTANNRHFGRVDVSAPPGFTDQSGAFMLEWILPVDWRQLWAGVERDTFLGTGQPVTPTGSVIRLYPERTIRPGESLETQVIVGPYWCDDDSWPCRKIFVDLGGAPVDLELIPLDGQFGSGFGLVAGGPDARSPQLRLTVNTPEVFIYGTGRVRLRASRPSQ